MMFIRTQLMDCFKYYSFPFLSGPGAKEQHSAQSTQSVGHTSIVISYL